MGFIYPHSRIIERINFVISGSGCGQSFCAARYKVAGLFVSTAVRITYDARITEIRTSNLIQPFP
jgi:hypothetical protein